MFLPKFIASYFFASALLLGCGGGGGGTPESTGSRLQGAFIDSPVSGLTYTAGTESGVTDTSGNFYYPSIKEGWKNCGWFKTSGTSWF